MNADGTMLVKLFDGVLDLQGKNTVHLVAPQQSTVDAQGNVGPAGPSLPDPNDPFGPQMTASDQASAGTTPGTEQDFIGAPIHNGEQQSYSYSYAGGGIVKAALGYKGSLMALKVKAPDGTVYTKQGPPPVVVLVPTAPARIYTSHSRGYQRVGRGRRGTVRRRGFARAMSNGHRRAKRGGSSRLYCHKISTTADQCSQACRT